MSQTHPTTHSAPTPKQFTLAIVESVVARHPGVTVDDVFGRSRERRIINARFEAIAEVVQSRPHWSFPELGRLFNRDHTTIMAALDRVGVKKPKSGKNDAGNALAAARSVGSFICNYEAVADQREHDATVSVATFVRLFVLPEWARSAIGGAE